MMPQHCYHGFHHDARLGMQTLRWYTEGGAQAGHSLGLDRFSTLDYIEEIWSLYSVSFWRQLSFLTASQLSN